MIYPCIFLLSLLFAVLAYRFPQKTFYRKLFICISIALPCILSAIRSCNIGTDVKVYAENWFNMAISSKSFADFAHKINSTDILYIAVTYLSAKIGGGIWLLFLLAQLLTITPIAYVASKNNNSKQYAISLLIYYLFFYNASLNLMRQSISLSMSLLSYYYLTKGNTKKYIIFTVIATLFHISGILGIVFYIVSKLKKKQSKLFFVAISIVSTIAIIIFFEDVIKMMHNFGILSEKYLSYASVYLRAKIDINIVRELYFATILLISLLCAKDKANTKLLTIAGFALFQIGLVSNYAYRISYIFFYPALFIGIPEYLSSKKSKNSNILLALLLIVFSSYWVHQIVIMRVHETYPYELTEGRK